MSGTATAPIRMTALTERQAFVVSDGIGAAVRIADGCAYWTIEGLRAENIDRAGGANGSAIDLVNVSHITVRRTLVAKNNRYINSHVIEVVGSSDIVVEDSEIYDNHRAGLLFFGTQRCTARRIYTNSRDRADIPGGYATGPSDKGDNGVNISCTP